MKTFQLTVLLGGLIATSQRDQISQGHKFAGARTHRQTGINSMQYANASLG